MKKVRIALLGFGNIGKGVWQILNLNTSQILQRSGYEIKVTKILIKDINKKREIALPDGVLTDDFEEIVNDDSIDIIVELIGGSDPALDYMVRAMKNKKHVVTANKLCVATYNDILFKTAKEEEVFFYYEGSVGGGIPIIREIKESLTANKIQEIVGIINGTTNYILTKMTEENMSFEEALKESQLKGYAEADPTDDIEGFDAAYKLSIISSLSFETKVSPDTILREGITKVKAIDIKYAKKFGYVIKLLAIGRVSNGKIEVRVHPAFLPKTHNFAHITDSYNAVYIRGNAVGDLMLYGKGAGDLPTGSAVVSDILAILRNNMNYHAINHIKESGSDLLLKDQDEYESQYYIRFNVKDKPGILGDLGTLLGKNNISIYYVTQDIENSESVQLVFMTHTCKYINIKNLLKDVECNSDINSIENIIRIESLLD